MFCVPTATGRSSLILQGWVSAEGSRETPRVVKMLYRRMPLWCAQASTAHPQIFGASAGARVPVTFIRMRLWVLHVA